MRLLSGLLVGLVLGCGGDDGVSPREARAELADLGIDYTAESFFRAAYEGDLTVVKLFVETGMSVNTRAGDLGLTVLHVAAGGGHLAVVKFLVGAGVSLTDTDKGGNTALLRAAWQGHLAVVEFLVGSGADMDARDNNGRTALHYAAGEFGHLAVVRYLVDQGADVNATDGVLGLTALHAAAFGGHLSVVQYLVGQGASVTATTNNGVTPRHMAARCSTDADRSAERRANCAAVVEYFDSL